MMLDLPFSICLLFEIVTLITFLLFISLIKKTTLPKSSSKTISIGIVLLCWIIIQGILSYSNVYSTNTHVLPPKFFVLGVLPTLVTILILFVTKRGKLWIESLPISWLTFIHVIRIPVELILYGLFTYKTIPEIMTFEGRNFDIFAGITAPIIAYVYFSKKKVNRSFLLIWNFISLALLLNIVITAILCLPSPFQTLAFEQPNVAILYFPYCWLATFIVPIVLFCHVASIYQLLKRIN